MENTAIQEAIENIEKRVSELNNMDEGNNLWKSSCAAELLSQRDFLISKLPKEREAIELAFMNGQNDVTFDPDYENDNGGLNPIYETTAQEYFTTKYKQDESK